MDQDQVLVPAQVLEQRRAAREQARQVRALVQVGLMATVLPARLALVEAQAQAALAAQAAAVQEKELRRAMETQLAIHRQQRAQALGITVL